MNTRWLAAAGLAIAIVAYSATTLANVPQVSLASRSPEELIAAREPTVAWYPFVRASGCSPKVCLVLWSTVTLSRGLPPPPLHATRLGLDGRPLDATAYTIAAAN